MNIDPLRKSVPKDLSNMPALKFEPLSNLKPTLSKKIIKAP